ncbi:hypothetical protein [Dietzia sp. CH92]|nr:hypothetical protein [Dietzia sp. CH92]
MSTYVGVPNGSAESSAYAVSLVRGRPHVALMPGDSTDISECAGRQ